MLVQQIISKARYDYKTKGLCYVVNFYVLNLGGNILKYPYYKYLHNKYQFEYNGEKLKYFCHWYNNTFNNERYVEISLLLYHLKGHTNQRILEVGNVTSHYFSLKHDVVDKYEKDHDVINEDIVDYVPLMKYDFIYSISTMEHVGYDERPKDADKVIYALERMRSMLNSNGEMIITIPKGYNPTLDKHIDEKKILFDKMYCFKRISKDNQWVQSSWDEIRHVKWEEKYPYANALIVGIYINSEFQQKI